MPLIDIASGKEITWVPKQKDFSDLRRRLADAEFEAIVDEINARIDAAGAEIATAGWLPGSDWIGTPFWPIYAKVAKKNYDVAARFFGLMVWYTVMLRPEKWGSGRFEKNGEEIGSRTYFRLGVRG